MTDYGELARALNFSWLEERAIAGCRGPRTNRELESLVLLGVQALVRLASEDETGLSAADVRGHGFADCYEPVPDWTAPNQNQIDRVISFIHASVAIGRAVGVSCGAGCGRTGTLLGCYLVAKGRLPEQAIEHLLALRPCSREILTVPGQRDAICEFHERLHRINPEGAV